MSAYSLEDVARICGVRPSRLRRWQRLRLIGAEAPREPRFGFRDLVSVRKVLGLIDQGVPLRRIRHTLDELRDRMPEVDEPLAALFASSLAPRRILLRERGRWVETSGQFVFDFGGESNLAGQLAPLGGDAPQDEAIERQARREEAWEWFERGCRLDGERATRAEAILAYQRALELAPDLADAHCNLGSIHYHQNRKGLARRCFERAIELDALHLEANLNLATLLEEVGRDEAALSHYRRALESDPFCADALVSIGLLFEKFGLRRRASEAWRRYLQLEPEGPWAQVARRHLEG